MRYALSKRATQVFEDLGEVLSSSREIHRPRPSDGFSDSIVAMKQRLPRAEWWATLPKKVTSTGVLFFDEAGKLLVVKPTYKDYWQIPGGIIEANEPPLSGAIRETKEEIGLDVKDLRLLGIAYTPLDSLQFTFYGGVLDAATIGTVKVDGEEISEFKFVETKEISSFVGEMLLQRLPGCIEAVTTGKVAYMEIKQTEVPPLLMTT